MAFSHFFLSAVLFFCLRGELFRVSATRSNSARDSVVCVPAGWGQDDLSLNSSAFSSVGARSEFSHVTIPASFLPYGRDCVTQKGLKGLHGHQPRLSAGLIVSVEDKRLNSH